MTNRDVFLSFRGEDTRNNFTVHLYQALDRIGINTYKDDKELSKGEEISPALLKAIEESKISIVIFSENYASSTWCLDELLKILECKESKQQKVLAVYYKVEPSTVRHQNGSFKEAFAKHEKKFDEAKVQRWKTALNQTAGLCGFHLKINEDEYEFIQKIVKEVSTTLPKHFDLHVAKFPVGIKSRVEDINKLLCIEENDIRMIGIFGVGGIGKTTIANEMYNCITDRFEGSCFLANVRESSKQDQGGLVKLQQTILSDILKDSSLKASNVYQGINLIMKRLCHKRILLVLDDVDCLDQLDKLCGSCDWFGSGSRIIITTRDEGLLTKHHVDFKYHTKVMEHHEARQLFIKHAFKSGKLDDGFADVIELALKCAAGLPLALKIIGSNLCGQDIKFWKSELKEYKRVQEHDIYEKLKISYDGLDDRTKKIFLDIACFFKGRNREYVTLILDGCGFNAYAGIKKLNDKCLITIDEDDKLMMHDLLEDMGKEIVRQEAPEEPGKRSRLYSYEDVREVLERNKGTEQIEGILINFPSWEDSTIRLDSDVFAKMEKLRILKLTYFFGHLDDCDGFFCDGLNYLSNELRVLHWPKCPLLSLPSNFHGEKLIDFDIRGSKIRDLGTRLQPKNLTSIDLTFCDDLTNIPDLSSCSNLEELIFDYCGSLVEVHDSVGFLKKLVKLSFKGCFSLKKLPRSFKLISLKVLDLEGCTSLEYFPEIECKMEHLEYLSLECTEIQELPSSITYFTGLNRLFIDACDNFVHFPVNIFQLEHLQEVSITGCPNFVNFGKEVGHNEQFVPCTQDNEISSSMEPRESNNLFRTFNFSSSLWTLDLSGSAIVSLPPCIERFVGLSRLLLSYCEQLEQILHLPPNIKWVEAMGCESLERFPHVSTESSFGILGLKRLTRIDLSECNKVEVDVGNHAPDPLLVQERFREKDSSTIIYPGSRIPEWFKYCKETTSLSKSIEVEMDHNASMCFGHQIVALVLCFVVGPIEEGTMRCFTISINGRQSGIDNTWLWNSLDAHHVCLRYIAGNSIDEILSRSYREGNNNMRFTFEGDRKKALLKSVGVHLIYRNDNFINPIQLSKRYQDDGEHDLAPDWNPQEKRQSSTTRIMEFNDANDDLIIEDLDLELRLGKESKLRKESKLGERTAMVQRPQRICL
ncbi:disease resistance protein Roq1-like isoform X3 [Carya illinoinensis]|uniref:disease resistance protein Roq1-like isoform X3 n=1 Tax=Carya illinoinensis TaxID=32201 RepID=UPI001C722FEB|nr:disease resistance protein Roq1-like isoform X3 [Carya illinoinensis]